MPRFVPSRYQPIRDSSHGYRTLDPTRVVLIIKRRGDGTYGCPCGCGEAPTGKGSVFKMGHDARLRGKLIRAHLTGTEVVEVYDRRGLLDARDPRPAIKIAAQHGWERALENAVLRRDGKNRQVLRRALGSRRLIRVGRWEYTGQVVAVYGANEETYLVEYVTRTGDIKRVHIPADQAQEVR